LESFAVLVCLVYLQMDNAGAVGFHSGSGQADSGWGCGYRNIQMQASHQLMRGDPAVRAALFGGCGFVPDVGEHRGLSSRQSVQLYMILLVSDV
jgi:hypothetical protein